MTQHEGLNIMTQHQGHNINIVGVNFKPNVSLSSRYESYLTSTCLTCPSTFLQVTDSSVLVATAESGAADPLITLNKLSNRWTQEGDDDVTNT